MNKCIQLAKKAEGLVSTNPLVGALIVKEGKIIGSGFHEKYGGNHAEFNAIVDANSKKQDLNGSTIYITLEPCCTYYKSKKTPPCVPQIINSGIREAVIGSLDPNPYVNGKGVALLVSAGIKTKVGILFDKIKEQNESFFKYAKTSMPFVAVKLAQSANGKIGIKNTKKFWISGKKFDRFSHYLRNKYDAILVGINTVLIDDPLLTCRLIKGRNPARIILDSKLRIPLTSNVLKNPEKEKVFIATTKNCDKEKKMVLSSKGINILICGEKKVNLKKLFSILPSYGIISVLVEGGSKVISNCIKEGLVDKIYLGVSKKKILDKNAINSPISLSFVKDLKQLKIRNFGKDTVYIGYLKSI
jgi:diaminohydroxyphosphoribosylaminopyrimidine deaminase/5-amino-6-(5-phosphoribosylamino)uracil reductase